MAHMSLGIIGLGRMGFAIAYRALKAGHTVIGYDRNSETSEQARKIGINIVEDPIQIPMQVDATWLMVPAGKIVDEVIATLKNILQPGMIIIDGGNSKFTDSMRRAKELAAIDVFFLDCGTSGGIQGQEIGFCLMIGGQQSAFDHIKPLFKAIAAHDGYAYIGPSGAGHYVKMVHNGIEYALLQSYAEGFHMLKDGEFKNLDLIRISQLWNHGSIIRSWILELLHEVLTKNPNFNNISGYIAESGMGAWTVEQAEKYQIPVKLIQDALQVRYWSQKTGGNFATKLVALLRKKFGGHEIKKTTE